MGVRTRTLNPNRLIREKLVDADWDKHFGHSESLFVNSSTWGLMLTGRVVRLDERHSGEAGSELARLVSRAGKPVIRGALTQGFLSRLTEMRKPD